MNSLVAIGSSTSFTVGAAAALMPQLGFDSGFMEEPVMLLAFVLLGRALEARAKVRYCFRAITEACLPFLTWLRQSEAELLQRLSSHRSNIE